MLKVMKHGDEARFRTIPELDGTLAISARYTTQRFRPHFHETFVIGATETGAELFEARGGRHVASAGTLRLFNPGEVHTGRAPEGGVWAYRCLYPSAVLLDGIAREIGRREAIWFPDIVATGSELARELLVALRSLDGPTSRLERSSRLRSVLGRIVVAHGGGLSVPSVPVKPAPRAVAAAAAYIGDRWADDFTIGELAREAGMSPYHLIRVFKSRRGLTPFAYQSQLRVDRARWLLAQGSTVDAAARACGFFDRSHLARVFRSVVGVTPMAYRRAVTGG